VSSLHFTTAEKKTETSVRTRTLHNLFWLLCSTGLSTIVNMTTNFFVARKLGATTFGQWSLILTTASWITVLRSAVGSDLIRTSAHNREYGRTIFIPALLTLMAGAVFLGSASLLANTALIQTNSILLPSVTMEAAVGVLAVMIIPISLFAGRDRMQWQLADGTQSLFLLLSLFTIAGQGLTIGKIASAYMTTALLVCTPIMIAGAWKIKPLLSVSVTLLRRFLIDCGHLFLTNWLYLLHLGLDLYVLQVLRSSSEVGVYSAALKLVVTLGMFPLLLFASLTPELTRRAASGDFEYVRNIWLTAARSLTILSGALALFLFIMSDKIIHIAYGDTYAATGKVLRVLCIALVPRFIQVVSQSLLFVAGEYVELNRGFGFGVVVQASVCMLLVPGLGPRGAAIAFIAAECATLMSLSRSAFRVFGKPSLSALIKTVVSVIAAIVFGVLLLACDLSAQLTFCAAASFYLLLAYLSGCFSLQDLRSCRSLLAGMLGRRA